MRCLAVFRRLGLLLLASVITASVAGRLSAQTTTGTIRGYVRDSSGAALSDAQLEAKNVANGTVRTATSRNDGSYIFLGLDPATYQLTVRHIGHGAQLRNLVVAIGTTVMADFALGTQAVELSGIQVTAAVPAQETRTSEVATNVSPQQIQALPTSSRNFLDLAALAPGVSVSPDFVNLGANTVTPRAFTAGAQGPGAVNVFIDGASLKNNLTGGETGASGISGQDDSRG
ncbi:MAG TPA: carboxypeptidase-like regulatory domain-containing protein, partial [Gemmatimonadales bacterium]|nr:carboxypeptidase-like regulatory domain-containing protein [Gemmatimonadales bacterium]